jgi:PAS domain S-box-containing protein
MQENYPVTQQEYNFPSEAILVSTTDLQGRISHCNHVFEETSGYSYDELIGQPHSLVRHPDMPPEAFYDMWATIGRGRPWTGIVKNRHKNGDHYWVEANVTPIMEGGKPKSYIRCASSRHANKSARLKPCTQRCVPSGKTVTIHSSCTPAGYACWVGVMALGNCIA